MTKEMTLHDVLVRPIITEKATRLQTKVNAYPFEVAMGANRGDIKKAVEEAFAVKVLKVRTMIVKGKPRRTRIHAGLTSNWKKAIVTLNKDYRIDLF